MNPIAYVRNMVDGRRNEFAYKRLVKQAKSYGRLLVLEQLDAGRWYPIDELDQKVEAGIAYLMSDVDGKFRSLSGDGDEEWLSNRIRYYIRSGNFAGMIGYKLGHEWFDKEEPWKRLVDEGKVVLEKGEYFDHVLPTSPKRTAYEEFLS